MLYVEDLNEIQKMQKVRKREFRTKKRNITASRKTIGVCRINKSLHGRAFTGEQFLLLFRVCCIFLYRILNLFWTLFCCLPQNSSPYCFNNFVFQEKREASSDSEDENSSEGETKKKKKIKTEKKPKQEIIELTFPEQVSSDLVKDLDLTDFN